MASSRSVCGARSSDTPKFTDRRPAPPPSGLGQTDLSASSGLSIPEFVTSIEDGGVVPSDAMTFDTAPVVSLSSAQNVRAELESLEAKSASADLSQWARQANQDLITNDNDVANQMDLSAQGAMPVVLPSTGAQPSLSVSMQSLDHTPVLVSTGTTSSIGRPDKRLQSATASTTALSGDGRTPVIQQTILGAVA